MSYSKKYFFISPLFCALLSFSIFLIAFFLPPDWYQAILFEKDYVYLDLGSFLFVFISIVMFIVGCYIYSEVFEIFGKKNVDMKRTQLFSVGKVNFIAVPIYLMLALNFYSIYLIIKSNPIIIAYMSMGMDSFGTIKNQIVLTDSLGSAGPMATATALWAMYYYYKEKHNLKKRQKGYLVLIISLLIVSCILRAVIKIARYEMMPLIFGVLVIYIYNKYFSERKTNKVIFIYFSIFFVFVISVFALFSFTRGFSSINDVLQSIIGYTLTSYNHMAALLTGQLRYLNPGEGYYVLSFFQDAPLLKDSISSGIFNWPATDIIRSREFSDTFRAGLNGSYIWLTNFGYLWVSLGLYTPLFFLFNGIIMQFFWKKFLIGRTSGLIFYPWFFFCVIFWFGGSMLSSKFSVSVLLGYLFIKAYESLFKMKS